MFMAAPSGVQENHLKEGWYQANPDLSQ